MKISSTEIWFMSPYTLPLLASIWASIDKEPIDFESERKSCFFYQFCYESWKFDFSSAKFDFQKFFQIVEWLFQDLSETLPDLEHAQEPSSTLLWWFEAIFKKWKFSNFFEFFYLKIAWLVHFQAIFVLCKHENFIFSKSKPLNENRLDRNLIYVPLHTSLAWFDLSIHR